MSDFTFLPWQPTAMHTIIQGQKLLLLLAHMNKADKTRK
uniref:Uncharacterized protein n=1 Tax=Anguilla anguilla TaxID=7936 RepID=A0A0E9P5W0_ANGAN